MSVPLKYQHLPSLAARMAARVGRLREAALFVASRVRYGPKSVERRGPASHKANLKRNRDSQRSLSTGHGVSLEKDANASASSACRYALKPAPICAEESVEVWV